MQNKGIECRPGFYSLNLKWSPLKNLAKGNYPNIKVNYLKTTISLPRTSDIIQEGSEEYN